MTLPPEPHAHRESPVDRFAGLKLAILIGCCGALVIAAVVVPVLWPSPTRALLSRGCSFGERLDGVRDSLTITGPQFVDADIDLIASQPDVRTLRLVRSTLSERALLGLLESAPAIRNLHLEGISLTPPGLEAIWRLPQLQELTIQDCRGLDPERLLTFASEHPLQQLWLVDLTMSPRLFADFRQLAWVQIQVAPAMLLGANSAFKVTHNIDAGTFRLETTRDIYRADLQSIQYPERVVSLSVDWQAGRLSRSVLRASSFGEISRLVNLESLTLSQPIDDSQMAEIGRLQKLSSLVVANGAFTDAGLVSLEGLSHLEYLDLRSPGVRGTGITSLAKLKELTTVLFWFPNCDPAAYEIDAGLPRLKSVRLLNQGLRDDGLRFFAGSPQLESLDLFGNPLTSAAIPRLKAFPNLTCIDLRGSQIPEADLEEFTEFLQARRRSQGEALAR